MTALETEIKVVQSLRDYARALRVNGKNLLVCAAAGKREEQLNKELSALKKRGAK